MQQKQDAYLRTAKQAGWLSYSFASNKGGKVCRYVKSSSVMSFFAAMFLEIT